LQNTGLSAHVTRAYRNTHTPNCIDAFAFSIEGGSAKEPESDLSVDRLCLGWVETGLGWEKGMATDLASERRELD
jgi:hypothetical protein